MWAHYGDKHKGLCLGFDVKEAAEVKYEPQRLKQKLDQTQTGVRVSAELAKIAMTTKFDERSQKETCAYCGAQHNLELSPAR